VTRRFRNAAAVPLFRPRDAGSGKIIGIDGARSFLLMVSASSGVPETYLTMDPSTGNLATAKEISPIFVMMIQERQTAWKNALTVIFRSMLESDDFEVSFPPIRDNINAYIQNVNNIATLGHAGRWAGTMTAKDYIKAAYEALEWKLPDDATLNALVASLDEMTGVPPFGVMGGASPPFGDGTDQGLNEIAKAAQELKEAIRQKPAA
jgi:hypothetical protein